jgi:LuxR family transcriptional regulator, maltose regulon positive regulatory protein
VRLHALDRAPAFRPAMVSRRALVERLTDAREATLALVVAPAGYGKSTLLSEWAASDERPVVWLTFDSAFANDLDAIVTALVEGFAGAEWMDPDDVAKLPDPGEPAALAAVMQTLSSAGREFMVVLDDAHVVADTTLREVVEVMRKHIPAGSVIAIGSRSEPALPTGRLRAHRRLIEVGMGDLELAPDEASELLEQAGVQLGRDAVSSLVAQTEGWPAALYLTALSMREHLGEVADAVPCGGSDYFMAEFLREEVLGALPRDLRDFALGTSVLESLSGQLCDVALETSGSALALMRLSRVTQLLVPLDPSHETYRWQHLVRDALRAELRRADPELEGRIRQRASSWFLEHGDIDRAIDHAVASGDAERAGALLWANIVGYLASARAGMVEDWLRSFGHDQLAEVPTLSLCAAHSALVAGKVAKARQWARAGAAKLEGVRDAATEASLRTGLAVLEAVVAKDGAVQMRDVASRAYQLESDTSPWRPALCLLHGVAEHLTGERDRALQLLDEGVERGAVGAPAIASLCLAVRAMLAIESRDWDTATDLSDRGLDMIDQRGLASCSFSALAFAAAAAARAHQGRADEAKRDLRRAKDLLSSLGDFLPWYGAEARLLLAHASLWLADVVAARTLLAEASRLARRTSDASAFEPWFNEAWAYMDKLAEDSLTGPSALTIAELRILRFLPSHRSFREIAAQLGVSPNTVKTQAHAVYRKLGAASRSEAVARGSAAGLLGL